MRICLPALTEHQCRYLILSLIFGFISLNVQAKEPGTFRFNVSPNGYPPYLIVDEAAPSGIMWDVLSRILPSMGFEVKPYKIPRKRVDQMLAEGFIDGTPRTIEWTKEPEKFLFTDPIVNVEEVFFFPADSPLRYESVSDLFGTTIVTPLGYFHPTLEPYFKSGKIQRFDVNQDRDMFRFVLHGKDFHAALADQLVGRWILRQENMKDAFRTSGKSVTKLGFRIMLRHNYTAFAEEFNRELAKLRKNGELDAILNKYR